MATLTQNFNWRKAQSLGLAHEKANYRSFVKASKKGRIDGHDQVSADMDLWNNEKGIAIGMACKCCDTKYFASRLCWIRYMNGGNEDHQDEFRRENFWIQEGNVIPAENYKGKWVNDKCLVPSNLKD